MIGIIDYNVGNIGSLANILKHIQCDFQIVNSIDTLLDCDKLILPGVGHFNTSINSLRNSAYFSELNNAVLTKKVPTLGICLGMQMFADFSEEGTDKGLGWIPGNVKMFTPDINLSIPHTGWNRVQMKSSHNVLKEFEHTEDFYFTHKFYFICDNESNVLSATNYGVNFHSMIANENIIGTQFHPEKSGEAGITLMKSFVNL